jgi:hypothetical protein
VEKKNLIKSRESFAAEVAQTIKENHGKCEGAFIFGISGKWGEGKTTFIKDQLKPKLGKDYVVVESINPWEFGDDKPTFLRAFLKGLQAARVEYLEYGYLWNSSLPAELDKDTSTTVFNVPWMIGVAVFIFVSSLLISHYDLIGWLNQQSLVWKSIVVSVLLPLGIAVAGKLLTIQGSSRMMSATDHFKSVFDKIIKAFKDDDKKVVIIIDDLDRVTPVMARNVLDNLRTFFNCADTSFVVAGDHSVLEANLGRELLPDDTAPIQREEGRRFLKKIFNIYWWLPLPTPSERDGFILQRYQDHKSEYDNIFGDNGFLVFQKWLGQYFDSNFRQIERFMDMVLFTFAIINNRLDTGSPEKEDGAFRAMKEKPLLVVRVLMIQDLCTPLFNKLLDDLEPLRKMETAADTQNVGVIEAILKSEDMALSPKQQKVGLMLMLDKVRFHVGGRIEVDIKPFFYLASDTSFEGIKGPTPDIFIREVVDNDLKNVQSDLETSGSHTLTQIAKKIPEHFDSLDNSADKEHQLLTLMSALVAIANDHPVHEIMAAKLIGVNLDFYSEISDEQRMSDLRLIWRWLDKVSPDTQQKYLTKFPFGKAEDFDLLKNSEESFSGAFTSSVILKWLVDYYQASLIPALDKMQEILPKIADKALVVKMLKPIRETFMEHLKSNAHDQSTAKKIIKNIIDYGDEDDRSLAGGKLLESIKTEVHDNLMDFVIGSVDDKGASLITRKQLEESLLSAIHNADSKERLQRVIAKISQQSGRFDESFVARLWKTIIDRQLSNLSIIIEVLTSDPSFLAIRPSKKEAEVLFKNLLENLPSDEAMKTAHINSLRRGDFWQSLPQLTKTLEGQLEKLSTSSSEPIKSIIVAVLSSWRS